MPTPPAAAERLATVLARQAGVRAADLAAALGVSVPTLHRLLKAGPVPVLAAGKARRTRYALRRTLRGGPGELPLYAVDASGRITQVADLSLVAPAGCHMMLADTGWPVPEESRDGWWEGLPYPLYDLRPQGFMGRQLARAVHRELAVSEDPRDWGDDDLLWVLSRAGSDLTGNLILGDAACGRFQQAWLDPSEQPPVPLRGESVAPGYGALAEAALAGGLAGSSAAGEFPKFTALRELPGAATPHVLVKFSGADGSPAVTRWADLLRAEHLALGCAARLPGLVAAPSRLLDWGGRTFLEVERFDRHGLGGRSPLVSLETVNAALLGLEPGGLAGGWGRLADALAATGLLSAADALAVHHLWWFGRLIANNDMHLGNLSLRPAAGGFRLAPVYDLLPMLYAPLPGGELPVRTFAPPLPLPRERAVWRAACAVAVEFWDLAAAGPGISADFRVLVSGHADLLRGLAGRV